MSQEGVGARPKDEAGRRGGDLEMGTDVFVVGATGALGIPVVRALVARGHRVTGLTRSQEKAARLDGLGARAVLGDVYDAARMKGLLAEARPDGVVQLLNALPKRGPIRLGEIAETNRLRMEGTRNVLAAATAAGAKRFVAESMIFGYGYSQGGRAVTEDDPFGLSASIDDVDRALEALVSLESQVLDASRAGDLAGVVLRLGLFYGPDVGSTQFIEKLLRRRAMVLPGGGRGAGSWIHVDDAASAVVAALERAEPGAVYNVVDDEPVSMAELTAEMASVLGLPGPRSVPLWLARLGGRYAGMVANATLRVSNERIKRELGWTPRYPTFREGVATLKG
jgi:nucleoside-diphosphate-sugar epimerase